MSEQNNIRACEEYLEAYNAHDYARMSGLHAEGLQVQQPGIPTLDEAAYEAWYEAGWVAFPDMTIVDDRKVAGGDFIATNWTMTATHNGPLATSTGGMIPATGRKICISGSDTQEYQNGKLVRITSYWDRMTLLAQLGVMPEA